jgi:hypothetical protein
MENTKKKKSRVGEFVIVILVVVCAFLVVADITTNLIEELDAQKSQVVLEEAEVGTPAPAVRPTYPPNYTPPPVSERN